MMTAEEKREYQKAYHEQNREKIRARHKAYYEQNREKIRAQHKAYYEQNHEKCLAQQKAYEAAHPLKGVWRGMMERCGYYKGGDAKKFVYYVGRGIVVCEEWRSSFKPFEEWALANGYKPGLQLDRIDNDGPYSPENCRFVTSTQNIRNRRTTVLAAGIPLATWYEAYKVKMDELGLTYKEVQSRFSKLGWTLEDSLFTPVDLNKSHRRSA